MKGMVLAALLSILLLGCTSQQAAPTATPSAPVATPAVTPVSSVSTSASGTPSASIAKAPADAAQAAGLQACLDSSRDWKVEYSMTADAAGTGTTSKFTQYRKGDKYRTDMELSGIQTRMLALGSDSYSCTKMPAGWSCTRLETQAQKPAEDAIRDNAQAFDEDGAMEVAGVQAKCFKGSVETTEVRYCISDECVPLYISTRGSMGTDGVAVSTETKADSYSLQAEDSDFELPAQPQ
jgi:hypothetical protein